MFLKNLPSNDMKGRLPDLGKIKHESKFCSSAGQLNVKLGRKNLKREFRKIKATKRVSNRPEREKRLSKKYDLHAVDSRYIVILLFLLTIFSIRTVLLENPMKCISFNWLTTRRGTFFPFDF